MLFVAYLLGLLMLSCVPKKYIPDDTDSKLVPQNSLHQYIIQAKNHGMTESAVTQILQDAGWKPSQYEEILMDIYR